MFEKLVSVDPSYLTPAAIEQLHKYARQVVLYDDIPTDSAQVIARIGDADAVLVNYTTPIGADVLAACPNIRYIGMCCSLYAPESANVDISAANRRNITVYGVRDYGDPGVVEYVISELVWYLHGFGDKQWQDVPWELTDLKVGIVGLGTTGLLIAQALSMLGADPYYYSRTRKPQQEAAGITYLPLHQLLATVDVVCGCLNRNAVVFHEAEFAALGNHKIMFNTSIGPSHDLAALEGWLDQGTNEFFCDTAGALGDDSGRLLQHPHVNCVNQSSGRSQQTTQRLSVKVLHNIEHFFQHNG